MFYYFIKKGDSWFEKLTQQKVIVSMSCEKCCYEKYSYTLSLSISNRIVLYHRMKFHVALARTGDLRGP
jgi:hypothetical protein